MSLERLLSDEAFEAAEGSLNPSGTNPFVTISYADDKIAGQNVNALVYFGIRSRITI